MRFCITRVGLNTSSVIEISAEEFARAREAKRRFLALLEIEEKFDIVLENFAEFEGELLTLTLRRSLFTNLDWSGVVDDIHTVNRRLANLLTTGRLYIYQLQHDLRTAYDDNSTVPESLKAKIRAEYDSAFGYRVMEALRNYIQHRGLPVYQVYYNASREEDATGGHVKWCITPSLSVDVLREDGDFKKAVLEELERMGKYVVITPLVRQYVEAIGRIHEYLREISAAEVAECRRQLEKVLNDFRQMFGSDIKAVAVVVEETPGVYSQSEQVFEELLGRYQVLIQKNAVLRNFSKYFVSGETAGGSVGER